VSGTTLFGPLATMQIPVSEAFQNGRQEVTLELEREQIQWLKRKAAEHDVSPDQLVRYLINRQVRSGDSLPTGLHTAAPDADAAADANDGPQDGERSNSSILDDLRDASSMLDDLTSDEESDGTGDQTVSPPTGAQLSAPNAEDTQPDASPRQTRPTDFFPDDLPGQSEDAPSDEDEKVGSEPESMFNMVDDEEEQ